MNNRPVETEVPPGSLIARRLAGASFHDAWCIRSRQVSRSALDHFIAVAKTTPRWIDSCMKLRNQLGRLVGLKDLGPLSGVAADKPAAAYAPGERVGPFTLIENSFDEVLFGDQDRHLDVVLSIHRQPLPGGGQVMLTVTTVVHVKNALGRLYMLPVEPMHRLIVPVMLTRAIRGE